MNRDDVPSGPVVALATAEMMVTARRLTARLPRLSESSPEQIAAAVAVVRAGLGQLWPKVPPEAARDVMVTAAELAWEHGARSLPDGLADQTAEWLLEMTGDCREETARLRPGSMSAPEAFASSVAFDRDEDAETLSSAAVLLTLAHLAIPGRDEPEPEDQADEPEPEDYDPGPEVDDEGGMSEYRYLPHTPEGRE